MIKIILIWVSILLLSAGNINAVEFKNTTHIITFEINDTVFIDNKNVLIECQPHTIYKDSYVYFNFSFKKYTGNADIYLGFTDNSCPINISKFDGKKYIKIEEKIEKIDYEHNNKNYWHFINNIKTEKNNSIRIWINVKENVKNGKYDFAIKPTGKNMHNSIQDKQFYILDPYYNTWYEDNCPCTGRHPCNNSMFIDIGNKKFLYIQSTYLCGDADGNGVVNIQDGRAVASGYLNCNSPIINYQILNYNNYIGINIIRPLKSDIYD